MQSNLHSFFEQARNLPLKSQVEAILSSKDFPIDFKRLFEKARSLTLLEAARKPANYKQRNYMAEVMYGNVIGVLYENWPQYMDVDATDRPYIKLAPNVRMYVKKLTESYLPNNIKTKSVKNLNAQELFENTEQIHVLYVGFVLDDKDWTVPFRDVCVSYINRLYYKTAAWIIDLSLEEYRKYHVIISSLDVATPAETGLVNIPRADSGKTAEQ